MPSCTTRRNRAYAACRASMLGACPDHEVGVGNTQTGHVVHHGTTMPPSSKELKNSAASSPSPDPQGARRAAPRNTENIRSADRRVQFVIVRGGSWYPSCHRAVVPIAAGRLAYPMSATSSVAAFPDAAPRVRRHRRRTIRWHGRFGPTVELRSSGQVAGCIPGQSVGHKLYPRLYDSRRAAFRRILRR